MSSITLRDSDYFVKYYLPKGDRKAREENLYITRVRRSITTINIQVVVIPKPSEIHLDSEHQLHAEDKPALVYSGFQSYADRGRYVNPK